MQSTSTYRCSTAQSGLLRIFMAKSACVSGGEGGCLNAVQYTVGVFQYDTLSPSEFLWSIFVLFSLHFYLARSTHTLPCSSFTAITSNITLTLTNIPHSPSASLCLPCLPCFALSACCLTSVCFITLLLHPCLDIFHLYFTFSVKKFTGNCTCLLVLVCLHLGPLPSRC